MATVSTFAQTKGQSPAMHPECPHSAQNDPARPLSSMERPMSGEVRQRQAEEDSGAPPSADEIKKSEGNDPVHMNAEKTRHPFVFRHGADGLARAAALRNWVSSHHEQNATEPFHLKRGHRDCRQIARYASVTGNSREAHGVGAEYAKCHASNMMAMAMLEMRPEK